MRVNNYTDLIRPTQGPLLQREKSLRGSALENRVKMLSGCSRRAVPTPKPANKARQGPRLQLTPDNKALVERLIGRTLSKLSWRTKRTSAGPTTRRELAQRRSLPW